ncbi:hypothetical protein RCCS2_11889 [Roseobacter sp. CCS2]|nr:hypothetical protein RCCS2_11889 [Roseobacter sp. CCS2]
MHQKHTAPGRLIKAAGPFVLLATNRPFR